MEAPQGKNINPLTTKDTKEHEDKIAKIAEIAKNW
jgi:hypothetical protein